MASQISEPPVIETLQDLILETDDVEKFLDELAHHAAKALSLPDRDVLCGITLRRHKKATTVASNSERAKKMDEIQYDFEDGPCLTASREGTLVLVTDFRQEKRWPRYVAEISRHEMRSALAVPFKLEGSASAALNFYSSDLDAFGATDINTAELYAQQASTALLLALRLAQRNETMLDLKAAMNSRTAIDVAVGIIMGQNQCSQDAASAILKAASNTRNVKLRNLATSIVEATGRVDVATHFED